MFIKKLKGRREKGCVYQELQGLACWWRIQYCEWRDRHYFGERPLLLRLFESWLRRCVRAMCRSRVYWCRNRDQGQSADDSPKMRIWLGIFSDVLEVLYRKEDTIFRRWECFAKWERTRPESFPVRVRSRPLSTSRKLNTSILKLLILSFGDVKTW